MKRIALLFALTIGQSCGVMAQSPLSSYDVSRDFSLSTNPSGVWSYGWKSNLLGTLTLLNSRRMVTYDNGVSVEWLESATGQLPVVYRNPTTNTAFANAGQEVLPGGGVGFRPGQLAPKNFGAIRFTVPAGGAGPYLLESAVQCYLNGGLSGDTDYHVVVNGVEVFSQMLPPRSATGFTNTLSLSVGDTVDFLVGRGADGSYDGSGLLIKAQFRQTSPALSIAVSKVKVTQRVQVGHKYLLESSFDLVTWEPTGPAFVAAADTIVSEFDVDVSGRFFRITEVP